jgi:beta-N-acetylhexosaminidase
VLQLMHSFRGYSAPDYVLEGVRRGDIGSFCLFNFNVQSLVQLRQLTASLYESARQGNQPPPIIGIDQEGGQLMAITHGATELPGNMALGATRSTYLAEQAGRLLGRELLALGINLNFAPSLDINSNPSNPAIGIRSFGDNAEIVSELGIALINGLQAEGVIATAKHFPGHGDVSSDPHHHAPVLHQSLERIHEVELLPFKRAIRADVKAIMSAHIMFSALDDTMPATLSKKILTGLLRQEMGFDELILTDAMDMSAVSRRGGVQAVSEALQAGADVVLLGHLPNQPDIAEKTRHLLNADSIERIQRIRGELPTELPPLNTLGSLEHQQIAQNIADHAITIVRDNGTVPLNVAPEKRIAVITTQPRNLTPADTSASVKVGLADSIRQRHAQTQAIEFPMFGSAGDIQVTLQATADADVVIVGTIGADNDPTQAELVRALALRGQSPIVIALRTPYDIVAFPMIETYVCTYSIRRVSMEAVARVLFGEIPAKGILPCEIPDMLATS